MPFGGEAMTRSSKIWLWFSMGTVSVLVSLVLILYHIQRPQGTPFPPPGPHQAGDVWLASLGGQTAMPMVWCPPGKFLMGSPATEKERGPNEPQREVTVSTGFWLGQCEVTQGQWKAIMGDNPSRFPIKRFVLWKLLQWKFPIWRRDVFIRRCRLPVERVSWDDCQVFCQKAGCGFQLPTEAQWEYACRAGSTGPYAGTGVLKEMAWYRENSRAKTRPGGQKKSNAWGLHDMHGNVCEWCQDGYEDCPAGAEADPACPAQGDLRVVRDGSWGFNASDCRAASRAGHGRDKSEMYIGFRLMFIP